MIARALSRTLYQKGSAAIPARRGRVPVASAVAPGAEVTTELLPRHLSFLPSERGDESLEPPPQAVHGARFLTEVARDGRRIANPSPGPLRGFGANAEPLRAWFPK